MPQVHIVMLQILARGESLSSWDGRAGAGRT